jgi:hypothetical protein
MLLSIMEPVSANSDFLGTQGAQIVRLGALAERYFKDDPNAGQIKLRQFGDVVAQLTAAKDGLLGSRTQRPEDSVENGTAVSPWATAAVVPASWLWN